MPLTTDYKETIRARVQRDPEFKEALLEGAMECFLSGDIDTGKTILRDFIKATVGFEELSKHLDKKPESLIRMFGPKGNPTVKNFFQILVCIQETEGTQLQIKFVD